MAFKTFRSYCEEQNATVNYAPNVDSNFMHPQNKSFGQVIDPLINDFAQKILTTALSGDHLQLEPVQIEYILGKVKEAISNLHYNPKNDLSKVINNIYRKGNTPSPETPHNRGVETPLADTINKIFQNRRRQ